LGIRSGVGADVAVELEHRLAQLELGIARLVDIDVDVEVQVQVGDDLPGGAAGVGAGARAVLGCRPGRGRRGDRDRERSAQWNTR